MIHDHIDRYAHLWRAFTAIVHDFEADAWVGAGFGITIPARLACHILQSTRYYIQDTAALVDGSGRAFDPVCGEAPAHELPAPEDIVALIEAVAARTEAWLSGLDLAAENTEFPWAGPTMHSVAVFLLAHSQFHLGELNALLNAQLEGQAADHWAQTVTE